MTNRDKALKYSPANFVGKDGKVFLVRCPECHRENYAMNVATGVCTWCPFDANKEN